MRNPVQCIAVVLMGLAIGIAGTRPAQAQFVVSSTFNPLQLATLHWEAVNSTTQFEVNFPSGGLACDGPHLWIASHNGTVTELQTNDGTVLGTFNVGILPARIAFDGTAIWVANSGSNTVTKLAASNGATLGTFPVGRVPIAVVSDGANL